MTEQRRLLLRPEEAARVLGLGFDPICWDNGIHAPPWLGRP